MNINDNTDMNNFFCFGLEKDEQLRFVAVGALVDRFPVDGRGRPVRYLVHGQRGRCQSEQNQQSKKQG